MKSFLILVLLTSPNLTYEKILIENFTNCDDAYESKATWYDNPKFKDGNGFEIYSLSLDKNKDAWLKAINQDQLFWEYHVSDLGGWQSEGSEKYNIRSIPSNVLINGKGIIIAKNLKGPALHRFLESQKK